MTIFLTICWIVAFAAIGALSFITDSASTDFTALDLNLSEEDDLP